ncbi:glycosyltransferase [Vibrio ziniensis]|uniref:Glycosyltransferase n=1 Tax=Vibrio ziniensis TaxID=2711221 RepID=A0A6G7CLP8_9VIBR|nr:glycosyltransferase [Vibrio ziniensis]QIH42973.1 glycosyltransferase [Vibrio ziniensis]
MKISVVIVTYNKKNDLLLSIMSLSHQTKKFDEIIIVDNNSIDGTKELLLKEGLINNDSDRNVKLNNNEFTVHYKNSGANIGGAGGFALGQKIALSRDADVIWFTDDDAVCNPDALEKLYSALLNTDYDIVNPLVVDVENNEKLSFGLSKEIQTVEDAILIKDERGLIPDLANPFNGTLFLSSFVRDIGFVKSEMFIWGDEVEYIKRAKNSGRKIATVVDAKVYHPRSKTTYEPFMFGLLKMEVKPEKLQMNYYRNRGYLAGKYEFGLRKYRFFIKSFFYFLSKIELRLLCIFICYYLDGYFDKYKLPNVR